MDLFLNICELLRPILFLVLVGYLPMKFGITPDVAFKPPSVAEIRESRALQLQRIKEAGVFSMFLVPIRLLVVVYFTIWLIVDKSPWLVVALFILTLLPLYFN